MFGRKLDTLLGLTTVAANPGAVTFNLVIKFIDSDLDDSIFSFPSAAARDAHADALITRPRKAKKIASITYDDTLLFWRRERKGDVLPIKVPELEGEGELVLRVTGRNNSTFEASGIKMTTADLTCYAERSFGEALEVSVIRRVVAYERLSVLVKRGSAPASASSFDSQTSEWT